MEDQLRKEGAIITNRWPMLPNVVVDRELISGILLLLVFLESRTNWLVLKHKDLPPFGVLAIL